MFLCGYDALSSLFPSAPVYEVTQKPHPLHQMALWFQVVRGGERGLPCWGTELGLAEAERHLGGCQRRRHGRSEGKAVPVVKELLAEIRRACGRGHVVGGSSCFHSLCGLFVIPRNKAVPAGLRAGHALCSGLNAFSLSFASSNFNLAVPVGDASMRKPLRLLFCLHNLPNKDQVSLSDF